VKSIQPFDMFPQTATIETVTVLERLTRKNHTSQRAARMPRANDGVVELGVGICGHGS
jgi:hypothetical protein